MTLDLRPRCLACGTPVDQLWMPGPNDLRTTNVPCGCRAEPLDFSHLANVPQENP